MNIAKHLFVLVFTVIVLGFALPALASAKSTAAVIAGIVLGGVWIFVLAQWAVSLVPSSYKPK